MKRVPLTLFILFLACLPNYSAFQAQNPTHQGIPVTVTQLGPKRSGPRGSFMVYTGIGKPLRLIIRDEDAWRDIWKQIHTNTQLPPLPEIDFSKEMIIIVALGGRPTGGYSIVVDGAYKRDNQLKVVVRSISSGKNCFVTQAVTAPIDIVRLPKSDTAVSFVETETVTKC